MAARLLGLLYKRDIILNNQVVTPNRQIKKENEKKK